MVQQITDLPGVGPTMAEKLNNAGFKSLMAIATLSPKELMSVAEITEISSLKIINAARNSLEMGFDSADKILKKRENVLRLSSGSKAFDTLIGGGFETGAISECFGPFGISKTQLAHQLAVNVQLPKDQGGADGKCIFIDTENTFRPERIIQMAKAKKLDPDKALKNIKVGRAFNSSHQMLLAEKIEELLQKGENIKLIVVDSLTAHFRAEYIGRGTLANRQQNLNKHMHILMRLADAYNLCVFVTNQVMSRPDMFFGDPTEAIGGHVVAHASTFRIYIRKGKKGLRVAKLIDSPNMPEGETTFKVMEEGIRDE